MFSLFGISGNAAKIRVHMVPGNYGLRPRHFLPIFWPHYSLFIREKCFHSIIYQIFFDKIFASVFTFIMA